MSSGLGALSLGNIDDLHLAISTLRASWATNREASLLYDEEFVRSFLSYPSELPSMLPALYCGDALGAFVGGAQRNVLVRNERLRLLLMTFLTVAADLKGNGLGVRVLVEGMKRAHASGYDGAIYYSVIGNKSNQVSYEAAESLGFSQYHVFTISFLMRPLQGFEQDGSSPGQFPISTAIDAFVQAAQYTRPTPIQRVWSRPEVEWVLSRPGALFSVHSAGDRRGVIAGYVQKVDDAAQTACVFIDDILWETLLPEERLVLATQFLDQAAKKASMAVVPKLGYTDLSIFRQLRFRESLRRLNAYLLRWHPVDLHPIDSIYIDVL